MLLDDEDLDKRISIKNVSEKDIKRDFDNLKVNKL